MTHVSNGPNNEPVVDGNERGLFSAFRFFDADPLTFERGRFGLYWRNGGPKCGLYKTGDGATASSTGSILDAVKEEVLNEGDSDGSSDSATTSTSQVGSLTSYVWYYTWQ